MLQKKGEIIRMNFKKFLQLKVPTIFKVLQFIWRKIQPTCYYLFYRMTVDCDFTSFFNNLSESQRSKLPNDFSLIVKAYLESSSYQKTSMMWRQINIDHVNQLISFGIDNFKQTVGENYFLFKSLKRIHDLVTQKQNYSLNVELSEIFKKHDLLNIHDSIQVNLITSFLANHHLNNGEEITVEEPIIGNPPYILINGKRVTSDLMCSLYDYSVLKRFIPLESINSVLEIGAGYGRTSCVILQHLPNVKYLICDIPPALYLSKNYLEQCFPEKKSVFIPSGLEREEVKKIIEQNDLIFFLPDLLSEIDSVDLFLAIDCLHEMPLETIDTYMTEAERITNYFYFYVHRTTHIPQDNIYLSAPEDYLKERTWHPLLQENRLFPDYFFHGLYQVNRARKVEQGVV